MPIDLSEKAVTAQTEFTGDDNFVLSAGKTLKVESTPDGEEHFNQVVPEGKSWAVTVFLKIVETDA